MKALKLPLLIVAVLLLVLAAGLAALTFPRIATPIAQAILGRVFGEGASVERAWVRYEPTPVIEGRAVTLPDLGRAQSVQARVNPMGVTPLKPLFGRLTATDGALTVDVRGSGGGTGANPADWLRLVRARDVDVSIRREAGVTAFDDLTGEASFQSGPIEFQAEAGGQSLSFEGEGTLSDLSTIDGRLRIDAFSPPRLAEALAIALPNLPPTELSTQLSIREGAWVLDDIEGVIGDSDTRGRFAIRLDRERPEIDADLRFSPLDFDDLGVVFGLPSHNEESALNRRQRRANEAYARSDRLLPDARVDTQRLREIDARLDLDADPVVNAPYPLSALRLQATLEDGVLEISRFIADGERGELTVSGTVDAARETTRAELSGDLQRAQLGELVPGQAITGPVAGEFDLVLTGDTFREAFASADGEVSAWSTDAEVVALYVEAAGLDLGEALALMFTGEEDRTYTDASCAVARLAVEDGIARLAPGVIETEDSLLIFRGDIDLETEELAIEVEAEAKDASLGELFGSVEIGGTLTDPQVDLPEGKIIAQAAMTAGLAVIAGPLAALPFIEEGSGENVPCGRLVGRANEVLAAQ